MSKQQLGGLPSRSATDRVECLVHDIETAWEQGLFCTAVTMDIEAAFDSILPGRLCARLQEQGWPREIIVWATSFLSNRTAQIRAGDFRSQPQPVPFGLPQGSPVSPILFLLFTAPLYTGHNDRMGYVDDVCTLSAGKTVADTISKAEASATQITNWCSENGLQLSISKSEVQHFHRGRQDTSMPVTIQGTQVTPNQVT